MSKIVPIVILILLIITTFLIGLSGNVSGYQPKTTYPTSSITHLLPTRMPDQWIVLVQVCAGEERLTTPTLQIKSDADSITVTPNIMLNPYSCSDPLGDDYTIVANDPKTITVTFNSPQYSIPDTNVIEIPVWVKNDALWWSNGQIGNDDFIKGIQYLIIEHIIKIPPTQPGSTDSKEIPTWVKKNANWWGHDQISDEEFVKGLQYLINVGIMKV